MIRPVAAVVCVGFIAYLFWRELRRPDRDSISWVPFCWMFIAGSRFVSHWLNLQGPDNFADAYSEGSSVDRAVFLLLIVWGSVVLARRNISWGRLLSTNKWLVAYFVFCLCSMAWSDEPFILAKRWFKDLGNPIVALVMLTERNPYGAIVVTLRRLAFAWMPLSALFIRYYPEFGRAYAQAGGTMYTGVADGKNTLGLSCLAVGIVVVWRLLFKRSSADRFDVLIAVMSAWLLYLSNSKTSLACLIVAIGIMLYASRPASFARPARVIVTTIVCVGLYSAADGLFNVKDYVLMALDRNPTLTNRTEVWDTVLAFRTNPLVGAGFMSFWTGERMSAIWAIIGAPLNQAHNGYLEQYLNLGYVGVGFIAAIALSAVVGVYGHLRLDYPSAVLRFCFLVAALLYNYTEASFYGLNNMWVLFLASSVDPRHLPATEVGSFKLTAAAPASRPEPRLRRAIRVGPVGHRLPSGTVPRRVVSERLRGPERRPS